LLQWLKSVRCEKFAPNFFELGCESVDDLQYLTSANIDEIGMKPVQKMRLLAHLKSLKDPPAQPPQASPRPVSQPVTQRSPQASTSSHYQSNRSGETVALFQFVNVDDCVGVLMLEC
jgi:hypothetical protein